MTATLATLAWLLAGALGAVLFIAWSRTLDWRNEVRFYAATLFLAGLIYFALGVPHGTPWLAVEAAGLALFAGLAWAGLRYPLVLAVGWLLHVGWDAGLHLALEQPVVGAWLPLLCLPYDTMVAAYLAWAALGGRRPAEVAA